MTGFPSRLWAARMPAPQAAMDNSEATSGLTSFSPPPACVPEGAPFLPLPAASPASMSLACRTSPPVTRQPKMYAISETIVPGSRAQFSHFGRTRPARSHPMP